MSTSVKWGDSSTGLWGGLHEVMSVGSPAPEKASGNPWPLCQFAYLENGGLDVSWWARLTLPGGDEDPVRAGCDPGKPGAGGTASPCAHAILGRREKQRAVAGAGWSSLCPHGHLSHGIQRTLLCSPRPKPLCSPCCTMHPFLLVSPNPAHGGPGLPSRRVFRH